MSGSVLLHLVVYAGIVIFLGVVAYRTYRTYKMPMHVRWELYPVAHEKGDKPEYGGSRFEELNWWLKPDGKSRYNELRVMIPEMTFLVALFEHNRRIWWWSFPFHFGLYLLSGMLALLICGALLQAAGIAVGAEAEANGLLGYVVHQLTRVLGFAGLILATVGAAGLLGHRLWNPVLRDYTSPAAIFNLVFFLTVFGVAWAVLLTVDPGFSLTRNYMQSLISFQFTAPAGSSLLGLEILLTVVLIAYIPMTHMSHFFLKWFTYHRIRWDDEPNRVGGKIEKRIIEQVQYPVTWSAPHINADGRKNWLDIATEELKRNE